MQPITTVPVGYLIGPIAAATVLNAFLFAGAWRGHQVERQTGRDPWWSAVGLALYLAALGGFIYAYRGRHAADFFDIFLVTIAGQACGVVIVYSLLHAFVFTRGKPLKDRAFAMVASLWLLVVMVGSTFFHAPK